MRRLGMLQPTREQVVPNQWQLGAGMKAACGLFRSGPRIILSELV